MLRAPSVQKTYDEFWSGDPAFVQLAKNASPKAAREHAAKIKRARETGTAWSELRVEGGAEPTKFVMRPIKGTQIRWFHDQLEAGRLGSSVAASLAFRCAIEDVVDTGIDIKVGRVMHEGLGLIADEAVADTLDAIDLRIVGELGSVAFEKARHLSPL